MEKSVPELREELVQLEHEIRLARMREIDSVMDGLLRVMCEWSISLSELDPYRRMRRSRSVEPPLFRDPIAGSRWKER